MSAPDQLNLYSDLQPEPVEPESSTCTKCRGTGWEFLPALRQSRPCSCRKTNQQDTLLTRARIPLRFKNCNLGNYYPQGKPNSPEHTSQARAQQDCHHFLKEYPAIDYGLLFLGPCGVGKTHLSAAVINKLITWKNVPCLFYDFRDLLKEIQGSYNPNTHATESVVLDPVYKAEVLVLDELGANKPTAWVQDTITQIINTRYNEKKITIITSNYLDTPLPGTKPGEETLTDRVGARLRSRLYEMCKTILVQGEDYRKKVLTYKTQPSLIR